MINYIFIIENMVNFHSSNTDLYKYRIDTETKGSSYKSKDRLTVSKDGLTVSKITFDGVKDHF